MVVGILVASVSQWLAKRIKLPCTNFSIAGIISLVPGAMAYRTMRSFVDEEYSQAIALAAETLLIAGGISAGLMIALSFFSITKGMIGEMESNIREMIHKYQLIQREERVLVGVSGGPDSMALLHWLAQRREELQIELFALHVHHHLRGEEADADQAYVERSCKEWGIPCEIVSVQVKAFAEEHRLSKQVAARKCRYHAFGQIAEKWDCHRIAVAHHADDQIETVTMRLIRGTGLKGLSGIPVKRQLGQASIIRPLLSVTRSQIEAYCRTHHIQPRLDTSNEEDEYTRNYIRHHLIPAMIEINPQLHATMQQMTDTLHVEDSFMQQEAERYFQQLLKKEKNQYRLDISPFHSLPLALQRRVILLILNCLSEGKNEAYEWGKVHIDQILQMTNSQEGNQEMDLPHRWLALREYDQLTFFQKTVEENEAEVREEMALELGKPIFWKGGRDTFCITVLEISKNNHVSHQNHAEKEETALFDQNQLVWPLTVRGRRPGDRIQPLGMKGHKKVKDIFIDEKVPVSERDGWPIITDQQSILWIPGLKISNRGRCAKDTAYTIRVIVEKLREGHSCD